MTKFVINLFKIFLLTFSDVSESIYQPYNFHSFYFLQFYLKLQHLPPIHFSFFGSFYYTTLYTVHITPRESITPILADAIRVFCKHRRFRFCTYLYIMMFTIQVYILNTCIVMYKKIYGCDVIYTQIKTKYFTAQVSNLSTTPLRPDYTDYIGTYTILFHPNWYIICFATNRNS